MLFDILVRFSLRVVKAPEDKFIVNKVCFVLAALPPITLLSTGA